MVKQTDYRPLYEIRGLDKHSTRWTSRVPECRVLLHTGHLSSDKNAEKNWEGNEFVSFASSLSRLLLLLALAAEGLVVESPKSDAYLAAKSPCGTTNGLLSLPTSLKVRARNLPWLLEDCPGSLPVATNGDGVWTKLVLFCCLEFGEFVDCFPPICELQRHVLCKSYK